MRINSSDNSNSFKRVYNLKEEIKLDEETLVLEYFRKAMKGKQIMGNVYVPFTFGKPDGKHVNLCVVCDLPDTFPKPDNKSIILTKVTPELLEPLLKAHGSDAVELRVVPTSIFGMYPKSDCWFRPEDESKIYLQNMLTYCNIPNVKVSDLKVKQ